MWNWSSARLLLCGMAAVGITAATLPAAAEMAPQHFNVVGTWSDLNNYKEREVPFWTVTIPEASGGAITAQITSLDQLGLKGPEVGRLLKLGVVDLVHADFGYIAEDNAVFEGVDLAGVAVDTGTARKYAEAYRPVLDKAVSETMGAKILMQYADPPQVIWCRMPFTSLADLKGTKIRTWNRTLADLVESFDATAISMPFAEVVPALQRGVVDCAITGTAAGYLGKWPEVAGYVYGLKVAGGATLFAAISEDRWNGFDDETRAFMTTEIKGLEEAMWAAVAAEDAAGLDCATGSSDCPLGEPGTAKLVPATDEDTAFLKTALESTILKRWADRCGPECAKDWNETIGALAGVSAPGRIGTSRAAGGDRPAAPPPDAGPHDGTTEDEVALLGGDHAGFGWR